MAHFQFLLQRHDTKTNDKKNTHGHTNSRIVIVVVVVVVVVIDVVDQMLMWRFMCSARWSEREKARSHKRHWNGRSPVCLR